MDQSRPPVTFSAPETWPEYGFIAEPSGKYDREQLLGGIRYASWPYCFEEHIGDEEPNAQQSGRLCRNRKILWKRISRQNIPAGWKTEHDRSWRIDGFFELTTDKYQEKWHRNAVRNLRKWEQQKNIHDLTIETVSFEEFLKIYGRSVTFKKAGPHFIEILERKWNLNPEHRPQLWAVRKGKNGPIIAGTAVHFFYARGATVLECPFFLEEAKNTQAPTGLMDHWFQESLKRHIPLLITVYLWQSGDYQEWEKLTQFKNSFGFTPYPYPPVLYRYRMGRLF